MWVSRRHSINLFESPPGTLTTRNTLMLVRKTLMLFQAPTLLAPVSVNTVFGQKPRVSFFKTLRTIMKYPIRNCLPHPGLMYPKYSCWLVVSDMFCFASCSGSWSPMPLTNFVSYRLKPPIRCPNIVIIVPVFGLGNAITPNALRKWACEHYSIASVIAPCLEMLTGHFGFCAWTKGFVQFLNAYINVYYTICIMHLLYIYICIYNIHTCVML